ncbi:hypothetical protein B4102_2159 [Heyndrickxia sporothermodurans]|uniref:Uncharacterized protein n=1 Tax=Heyndrickxia sporothermodurans TaxID=46224 RepID=A0A150LGG4_9BACI|nr:hypothetical protein [Heyndrickxia sporothermodurans]KYD11431.1 hypothetical protein B4102_2159 [Heyndrickxia sporothermodurans]
MKHIEKQQSNIEGLLKLVKDNPELEIVPMVDNDVCGGDDFGYWMGSWGKASIDEVYHLDERIYFRSKDEDELVEKLVWNEEFISGLSEDEAISKAENVVNHYEWEKVIAVYINVP